MPPKQVSKRPTQKNPYEVDNNVDGEGEGTKNDHAKWSDPDTEVFLKVCVEEINAGNRPHSHFTREGWKNLIKKFNERTCHTYSQKQLKNRWEALKKNFFIVGKTYWKRDWTWMGYRKEDRKSLE